MKKYNLFLSPDTPDDIRQVSYYLAKRMAELGYFLSVVDPKAEKDAIKGAKDGEGEGEIVNKGTVDSWEELESVHPTWYRCGAAARAWHAKRANAMEESQFLVIWTPNGEESAEDTTLRTGGLGQAIRLASQRGMPIFNLSNEDALTRIGEFVQSI